MTRLMRLMDHTPITWGEKKAKKRCCDGSWPTRRWSSDTIHDCTLEFLGNTFNSIPFWTISKIIQGRDTHTHTLQALWGGGDGQKIRFFGDSFGVCKVGGQLRQETSIIQTPTSSFVAVVNHLSRRRPWMQMMTIRIGQLIPTIDRYTTRATFGWAIKN